MASYSSWSYNIKDYITGAKERRDPQVTVLQVEARRILNYKPHKRSQAYYRYLGLRFGLFDSHADPFLDDQYAPFENMGALDVRYGFKFELRIGPVATFLDLSFALRFYDFELSPPPRVAHVEFIPDLSVTMALYIDRWLEGVLPLTILKP